jgi:hypothetical protein
VSTRASANGPSGRGTLIVRVNRRGMLVPCERDRVGARSPCPLTDSARNALPMPRALGRKRTRGINPHRPDGVRIWHQDAARLGSRMNGSRSSIGTPNFLLI